MRWEDLCTTKHTLHRTGEFRLNRRGEMGKNLVELLMSMVGEWPELHR